MSNVRKTLADFAASIITAYESDLEDAERCFAETETRAVTAEKELAAAQEKLARRSHEPGALVAAVDAESRLVAETARALDAGICPNPRHEDGPKGDRPSVFCRECYDLATRSLQELKERAQKAESQLQGARSEREQIKAELLRERDSHDRDGKALLKLRADKKADEEALASRVSELEQALQNEKIDHNNTIVKLREAQADARCPWREKAQQVREWLRNTLGLPHLQPSERLRLEHGLAMLEDEAGDLTAKPEGRVKPLLRPTIPGIPCQPPEEIARGVLDLERAEARDATGRAP